jgi:hypothetical protein
VDINSRSFRAPNSRIRAALTVAVAALAVLSSVQAATTRTSEVPGTALGIDVNFYTGPITHDVWEQVQRAGEEFAIAQAWGGRSRNEYAASQLAGARAVGMRTAAYVLLNYDNQVCPTFDRPVRSAGGLCAGTPIPQPQQGGRWQVRQGIAALGSELEQTAFVAIDVEWFLSTSPPSGAIALQQRRNTILDAIDEVIAWRKQPVIYTRNGRRHWLDITGCAAVSADVDCERLHSVVRHPKRPVPLWDVDRGYAELAGFQPHGPWTSRVGRQYSVDKNLFGLPPGRTVDLNVFDAAMFSSLSSARR